MNSTANKIRPKVINAGMVGLTDDANAGSLFGGTIMGVPSAVFKRSNRSRAAVGRNRNPVDFSSI
jgi:hypothetical protein